MRSSVAHVVVVADGHAAARDHRVAASAARLERRRHHGFVVARHAQVDASTPACSSSASSIGRLASRILPGLSAPDSTSSSPVESTPTCGAADDLHPADVDAREHAEVRGAEHGAGAEHASLVDVAARPAHVIALRASPLHEHAVDAVAFGALDHDDGIGAVGHRRAGHDADRLARRRQESSARDPPGAPPPRGAERARRPWHRRCSRPAPRTRPSRCWRTAGSGSVDTTSAAKTSPSASDDGTLDRSGDGRPRRGCGADLVELDHKSPRSARARRDIGQVGSEVVTVERELDVGLEEPQDLADVVAAFGEDPPEDRSDVEQERDGVGELVLAVHARLDTVERVEDRRREDVAADDREVRGRLLRLRLLDDAIARVRATRSMMSTSAQPSDAISAGVTSSSASTERLVLVDVEHRLEQRARRRP